MTFRVALLVGLALPCPAALAQRTPGELAQALQKAALGGLTVVFVVRSFL